MGMHPITIDEDEAFLQQLVLSEEDRQRRHPTTKWTGGYRWFRSDNVIRLECYRDKAAMERIISMLLRGVQGHPAKISERRTWPPSR
jgi:hypothetical protein